MSLMNGFYNGNNNYTPPFQNQLNQLNRYMEQLNNMNNTNNVNNNNVTNNQSNTNMDFIPVENLEKAKEFAVNRGSEVWLRDSFEPYLYYKAVNSIGATTFRILKIDDVTDEILGNGNLSKSIQQEMLDFVPVENFNKLNQEVKDLTDKCNRIEAFIINSQQEVKVEKSNKPKSNSTPKAGAK